MKQEVAERLMGLTDRVVDSAVWQVKFWIPIELVAEVGFIIATLFAVRFVVRGIKAKSMWMMDDLTGPLSCLVAGSMMVISLIVLIVGIPNTISAIYNPTFWAIRELLPK
jgi:hypothetical protein